MRRRVHDMRGFRLPFAAAALTLAASGLAVTGSAHAAPVVTDACVDSVPEPSDAAPVSICYTLYRPAAAGPDSRVPVVFHSHGWGGRRTSDAGAFGDWLAAGFGVISFDQRGFGDSGGQAHVEHPDFEGQDVQRLVDVVAALEWVALDGPGDPVIGAIGGSYGGGYQYVGAYTELRDRGATRFNALAPEITWWDLKESLAPSEVVRTAWATALYGAGIYAHTDTVHRGFAYGSATGDWPKGEVPGADLDAFFEKNGPRWHAANNRLLDIPVVAGQGVNDNLFNLNQGLKTFGSGMTPGARSRSIFIGYNGGHALPAIAPRGAGGSGDPCSASLAGGSFSTLVRRFFREELLGEDTGLGGRGSYHISTSGGRCVTLVDPEPNTSVPLGAITTATGIGAPQYVDVSSGPISVAGTPYVDALVTTTGLDNRAFFALAVGTSALDATIVQNNLMPLRVPSPVSRSARTIELPAVAVDVPPGHKLYLAVSPVSDLSFGHGSRVPGLLQLTDAVVRLPVVAAP